MPTVPEIVAFPQLTHDGQYPVRDVDGRLLARFTTRTWSRRFVARTPDGAVLCTGRARRLLRSYVVSDASGARMLTLHTSPLSSRRRTARLADGSRLRLAAAGRPNPTWTVTGPDGRTSLLLEPARGRWSLFANDLVARVDDPAWDLALVVAVVVGNRMEGAATRLTDLLG